jgi:hypothetical protein
MEALGLLFLVAGYAVALIAGIWLLIIAFQEHVGWGLACLFLPIVSLIFVITHWEEAKKPFLIQLAAIVPIVIGLSLQGTP